MKGLFVVLLSLICVSGFSQAETHNFITYDTVIKYFNSTTVNWQIRISRPANMFVPNDPDTASRPAIITMPGAGEVGTDTNYLTLYGPHYWMLNGWDGGIQLSNGKHYPILITVVQGTANTRGAVTRALIDTLRHRYHIKWNSIHLGGLSQGGWVWGQLIQFAATSGDTYAMSMIKSFVNLEGVPANNNYTPNMTFPTGYGYWAKHYAGKYFSLYGTNDTQHNSGGYSVGVNMNDSFPNSAFTSFETSGGGNHCCWNSMYDPSYTQWLTGSLVGTKSGFPNFAGDYYEPSSIFQWMLRQGDTTLVGGCNPVVDAGQNQSIYLPTTSTSVTGSVTLECTATSYTSTWSVLSKPNGSNPVIASPSSLTTSITGLSVAGTYSFQLSATDNTGLNTQDNLTVTILPLVSPTVQAGGPYNITAPTSTANLVGTVSGNGGATITSILWTQTSGAAATITSPTTASTSVTGLSVGSYSFLLKATDNNGNSSQSTAIVQVNASNPIPIVQYFPGEYCNYLLLANGKAYSISNGYPYAGTNQTGTLGAAMLMALPNGTKTIAPGLHGGCAVDSTGHVRCWGDGSLGQIGDGNIYVINNWVYTPSLITTDSLGNTFDNVRSVVGAYAGNYAQAFFAVKNDGSLWGWGGLTCGLHGNGDLGDTTVRPVPIPLPSGKVVQQVVAGSQLLVLFTDGTVYTCGGGTTAGAGGSSVTGPGNPQNLGYAATGTQYLTLTQIPGLSNITQIAGGLAFNYALNSSGQLYGWGFNSTYMGGQPTPGNTTGPGSHYAVPTLLSTITNVLPAPISQIVTNYTGTHAILTDSTLWGWGDNAIGGIGNGREINWSTYSTPYNWNFGVGQFLQILPVRITGRHDYVGIFGSSVFDMYSIATTLDGTTYAWGRQKGAGIGLGYDNCSSNQAANYANWFDVLYPTQINPFTVPGLTKVISPLCVTSPGSANCGDAGCSIPTLVTTPSAGGNQNINTTTTTLNGSGSTVTGSGGKIIKYEWSQVSGPSQALFFTNSDQTVNVSNLTKGQYVFQLKTTDNAWNAPTSNAIVNVGVNCNCIVFPNPVIIK